MLTDKQRALAAIDGQPVDRFPVAVPYIHLLQTDHWCELTGLPAWAFDAWLHQDPAEHVKAYVDFDRQLPFDFLNPGWAPTREERERQDVVHQDGKHYLRDHRTGELKLINEDLAHRHAAENEERKVFDRADADRLVQVQKAEDLLESGVCDHIRAASEVFAERKPLLNGVTGTFWQCTFFLGETNLFSMLYDAPDLVHYLEARLLEKTIERIRALAMAGDDVIWIDDALTTSDLISPACYERFSMPYVKQMIDEIHALGKKALLIYFGGVADRVEQIASLGADLLNVEASMKAYTNDLADIQRRAGDRMCLWGNVDPVSVVQEGSDEVLRHAIAEQVAIGRRTGRFIISTGSPISPLTPVSRIRQFIDLAHELGASGPVWRSAPIWSRG